MLIKSFAALMVQCLVLLLTSASQPAHAGSISDSEDGNSLRRCDRRITMQQALSAEFCTEQMRDTILDQCFVIVHENELSGRQCSWQGCKSLSLVGQAAALSGEHFVEYGVRARRGDAPYIQVDDGVLPQHPYMRHYITARTALEARNKRCRKTGLPSTVENKLCQLNDAALTLNPYFACLKLHRWLQ